MESSSVSVTVLAPSTLFTCPSTLILSILPVSYSSLLVRNISKLLTMYQVAPATGTPETGGWTTRELRTIVRGLDGLNFVGADIVEVAPAYDTNAELTTMFVHLFHHSI